MKSTVCLIYSNVPTSAEGVILVYFARWSLTREGNRITQIHSADADTVLTLWRLPILPSAIAGTADNDRLLGNATVKSFSRPWLRHQIPSTW